MSDQMYREVILDHYKNPRGHGVIEDADAEAEGFNPLCGDEVSIYVSFADDGETTEHGKVSGGDRRRDGRGARWRDQSGRDLDARRHGEGPQGNGPRADAQGRAARGDRHP